MGMWGEIHCSVKYGNAQEHIRGLLQDGRWVSKFSRQAQSANRMHFAPLCNLPSSSSTVYMVPASYAALFINL